ncbi:hypothetical protein BHM03_00020922 [Ensete ventricosum]|uniref:Uncharacterized protein n=1 Tax=Ensete ventricosum TaxID=4639 RepID=A0A445MFZ9_ENSVE|nr:hypothetical protein BHM03_00020922 [Ensete ventricosum]
MWNQSDSSSFWSGTTDLHTELEELVARFVGKPAAVTFGMGYVTNSAIIPVLIGKVCRIIYATVISKVGDLAGIKYFPVEPPKHEKEGHEKLE